MSHDPLRPLRPPVPRPADRDRRAGTAPTVAAVLPAVPGPVALPVGAMSPMATDRCGPDDCSQDLVTALDVALRAMLLGGVLTFRAWLTSWLPPWRTRRSAPRVAAAFLSPVPPLFTILPVSDLPGG